MTTQQTTHSHDRTVDTAVHTQEHTQQAWGTVQVFPWEGLYISSDS